IEGDAVAELDAERLIRREGTGSERVPKLAPDLGGAVLGIRRPAPAKPCAGDAELAVHRVADVTFLVEVDVALVGVRNGRAVVVERADQVAVGIGDLRTAVAVAEGAEAARRARDRRIRRARRAEGREDGRAES